MVCLSYQSNIINRSGFYDDYSWRVRWMVANRFSDLCSAVGPELSNNLLLDKYVCLLKDNESEVRSAAAENISRVCELVNEEAIVRKVIPLLKFMVKDDSKEVRNSLACSISGIPAVVGADVTNDNLLEIYLNFLSDEISSVRFHIINDLHQITEVIGIDKIQFHLVEAINQLSIDSDWRIRQKIVETIPLFTSLFEVSVFNEHLVSICMRCLDDKVAVIRKSTCIVLSQLATKFGNDWVIECILPKIISISKHQNYLFRVSALYIISSIVPVVETDLFHDSLFPVVLDLVKDPVPNIRLNACDTLGMIGANTDHFNETLKELFDTLEKDIDEDVKYRASLARKNIN
eukprot:TRINITY_DN6336_c0_g1_i1.p1 TRINITY_DN6336_c0_g1~~TRINITY_DN6336_c0_g1_i1.p1  ORF type:complete len:347 (-),score=65.06 TRINITY_DN6336_c0_g1_i1:108-1148(-)